MGLLDELLLKTSRTFALAIPLLAEPTRKEVGLAYLLFRIADTFEDAEGWPRAKRLSALQQLEEVLEAPAPAEAVLSFVPQWLTPMPSAHKGYQQLIAQAPAVVQVFEGLSPKAQRIICKHVRRTCEGMRESVERADERGRFELSTLEDLRRYCYWVAGIVGELLTELFLLACPSLEATQQRLKATEVLFGEGLQLVNILKDRGSDKEEGRSYLPTQVPLAKVFALAQADLLAAVEYTDALQEGGANRGILAFVAFPLLLAKATLRVLEKKGAGAKISRLELMSLLNKLNKALDEGKTLRTALF
ncbi:MAG: squalene/phytoene synthase family protein [Cystobacterineae bacterium]|nr:squalene/phytoene synthase family protein [Cystobacterineae bacterium]